MRNRHPYVLPFQGTVTEFLAWLKSWDEVTAS